MKFKFRADAQDILMFLIFAVFLLYIVAIGVINLNHLSVDGTFYGLNPFPAFQAKFIVSTLAFYFLILLGLFLSVSSLFFERDDGIGFTTSKKDKGYSRWAKDREIKNVLKKVDPSAYSSEHAGIPLISKNGELWVDDGEYHSLVIGATGSGKTVNTVLPSVKILAKKGESMVVTDPKGEIYEKTGKELEERGYNIILLNFRNPQKGNAWNPMTLPYELYINGNKDKSIELLDDLALNILYEENSGNADPFWEKTSADYFSGLALAMFDDAKPEEININSISLTTTVGEEKLGGSTVVREYFNTKDPSSPAYINASGTILAPNETRGSIISVFKQKIKLFSSRENLSEMLGYSDFEMKTIGEKPTAVFIIIQDEKKTYHSLATIFIKQCYETLIDVAQEHGGKLPCRTNFILDEFANMPPLKDVTTMITAARSRQIRFTMIIQNFAQLTQIYGKENAETIKGNCGNIVYLITTEIQALEEISKLAGEVKSKKDDKTASTPLVTVSDLQRMKQFDQILLRLRMQPFKTSFVPDFKINWGNKHGLMDYPEREKKPLQIFDVREFVKNARQKKIQDMMGAPAAGAAGGSGLIGGGVMPPSPRPQQPPLPPRERPTPYSEPVLPGLKEEVQRPQLKPKPEPADLREILNSDRKEVPLPPKATQDDYNISDVDIDDLVRKIDAKIAELEKEEEAAKAQTPKSTEVKETKIEPEQKLVAKAPAEGKAIEIDIENKINEIFGSSKVIDSKELDEKLKREVKPIVLDEDIDDDEFFDDFFES